MKSLPVHVIPFPVYPSLQAHVKDPFVFVHVAFESQGDDKHSLISARVSLRQLDVLKMSHKKLIQRLQCMKYIYLPVHVIPSPVYPSLQAHVKDPGVFVHMAFE